MIKLSFSKGVTLIELLILIAVLGVVSVLGVQGFRSIFSGSDFGGNKTIFLQYLNNVRYKAYVDNKHYKIQINNSDENITVKLFEPESTNTKWRDLSLVRKCNCHSGTGHSDTTCNQSFSNVEVSSLTSITSFDKTIENINVKNCNDVTCSTETATPVEICYLFDGTSSTDLFFKVSGSGNLSTIHKINKTGYVE